MALNNSNPIVSILTPAYQAAKYLQETLDSVVTQGYPNIEHIVMDGGSTDETIDILEAYLNLTWRSEPDKGQSDALNKAFALAKGQIIGWLNADDLYEPEAIAKVVSYFLEHPKAMVVYGNCTVFEPDCAVAEYWHGPYDRTKLLEPWRGFHGAFQPAIFYRREVIERIGGWDADLHYVMDYDLLLRASELYDFDYLEADVARFRRHPEQKGALAWHKFVREFVVSIERYWRRKGIRHYLRYTFKARDFYALALLDDIVKESSANPPKERATLWQAVQASPFVLRYAWIRQRCLAVMFGPRISNHLKRALTTLRGN